MGHHRRVTRRRRIQRERRDLGVYYRPWARARSLAPLARRIGADLSAPHARVVVTPTGVGDGCSVTYTLTARPAVPAMGSAVLTVESVASCVASLAERVATLTRRVN
jgi:hypothetical protein